MKTLLTNGQTLISGSPKFQSPGPTSGPIPVIPNPRTDWAVNSDGCETPGAVTNANGVAVWAITFILATGETFVYATLFEWWDVDASQKEAEFVSYKSHATGKVAYGWGWNFSVRREIRIKWTPAEFATWLAG